MWSVVYTREGIKTILEQDNPKFYSCKRFFTNETYKKSSKLPISEVVSVDCALFPYNERTLLDEKTSITQKIMDGLQILRVCCITNEVTSYYKSILSLKKE